MSYNFEAVARPLTDPPKFTRDPNFSWPVAIYWQLQCPQNTVTPSHVFRRLNEPQSLHHVSIRSKHPRLALAHGEPTRVPPGPRVCKVRPIFLVFFPSLKECLLKEVNYRPKLAQNPHSLVN